MADFPHPKDKLVLLKRIPVFSSCNEKQLLLIADRTRLLEFKKGEYVYREGDTADAFYIVVSGRLRVISELHGQEKVISILHNDDSFGEISLLTGETHSATVQAINDTLVLQLEKDDFDDVINRIPSLVLHLSRLLSKRLRVREGGGEFAEATLAAVYSAAGGVGSTLFTMALATALKRETGRETVVVDFSGGGRFRDVLYGPSGPTEAQDPAQFLNSVEELLQSAIVSTPLGFSVLPATPLVKDSSGKEFIAPLLSTLATRFAYVLLDLPPQADDLVFKALTQSDIVFFITHANKELLTRTKAWMDRLRAAAASSDQRIRVVLNLRDVAQGEGPGFLSMLLGPTERMELSDVVEQLGGPVDFLLPHVPEFSGQLNATGLAQLLNRHDLAYSMTVRRIARELGGMLVGLALGSGAALGLAHIGVLKVFEREKIPIDMIAGTSIGSLVGGLWACGRTAVELEQLAHRFKRPWGIHKLFILDVALPMPSLFLGLFVGGLTGWAWNIPLGIFFGALTYIVTGLILGPLVGGPIQGTQLTRMLQEDFGGKQFEETRVPLKIVAANPVSREEVVFDSGPIADAVRASVSIPGIFKPVKVRNRIYLDGGVLNPIPVSVLRKAGANRVIAINVFLSSGELKAHQEQLRRKREERDAQLATRRFPMRFLAWLRQEISRSFSPLVFDVIMRSMQAMEHQIAEVACHDADITLRPTVPGAHWLEFFSPEVFIRRGEEVALQHLPEIKRLAGMRHDIDNP